jgi:HSP20 family protein
MSRHTDDPLVNLQREVERLFHGLVYQRLPAAHFGQSTWAPAVDLVVSRDGVRVIVELAGVPRDRVDVRLSGRRLEISGHREPPREQSEAHYHLAEIFFGNFHRVVELPWLADDQSIQAHYREGMLEIHLRPVAADRAKDIPVKTEGR